MCFKNQLKQTNKFDVDHDHSRLEVPLRLDVLGDGHERLLVDPGVSALVEGEDAHAEAGVLLDDLVGLLVRVERVHEDEGHVGVVLLVERLDLLHGQVEEGQVVAEGNHGFGTLERNMSLDRDISTNERL